MNKCRGQGYDDVNNMKGNYGRVQKLKYGRKCCSKEGKEMQIFFETGNKFIIF